MAARPCVCQPFCAVLLSVFLLVHVKPDSEQLTHSNDEDAKNQTPVMPFKVASSTVHATTSEHLEHQTTAKPDDLRHLRHNGSDQSNVNGTNGKEMLTTQNSNPGSVSPSLENSSGTTLASPSVLKSTAPPSQTNSTVSTSWSDSSVNTTIPKSVFSLSSKTPTNSTLGMSPELKRSSTPTTDKHPSTSAPLGPVGRTDKGKVISNPTTASKAKDPGHPPTAENSHPCTPLQRSGLVSQCLIAIASLAGLATVFMVCSIVLCTKISTLRHRYRLMADQQGTEMVRMSAWLPDGDGPHGRPKIPKSNGALIPILDGDSDCGDSLTLNSFLPDNERV
ncbi:P-selectin glycoprotein ligand 1 [Denticeps clupeoides]|uniref:P-selectin glycoprotein ligand 1 n=1 Tax=Denticeps clupeoides TaxID=299321 RepID=UPI0010A58C7E|nr:P-selectin glycoprotein ligand 1 [Denticeps clupeoides]